MINTDRHKFYAVRSWEETSAYWLDANTNSCLLDRDQVRSKKPMMRAGLIVKQNQPHVFMAKEK